MPKLNRLISEHSSIRTKYHIIFWLSYFTFNVIRWGSYFNDYWYSLKSNLVEFPLHIMLVYINIYYLIPKFILKKQQYLKYFLSLSFWLALVYVLRTGLNYYLVTQNFWPEAEGDQSAFTFNHIVAVVLGELYVMALATAIKLTVDWVRAKQNVNELKRKQLRLELNLLKSQIQPHFFFNTLNNLYALTLEKSDSAPSVVLKLSDMMQYVLYDVKESSIRLIKELEYVQNYLDLERMRFGTALETETKIKGDIEQVSVPPLLFLPFIENCFKHGSMLDGKIEVEVSFENISNQFLLFEVKNSYKREERERMHERQGIGIRNVERRLELLFPGNYELDSIQDEQSYCVRLKIPINES